MADISTLKINNTAYDIRAKHLGATTVGGVNRGIYLNAGSPTALTWYPIYCTINSGNKSNYPWHRFATTNMGTGSWVDKDTIIYIESRYKDGPSGALKISARCDSATSSPPGPCSVSAAWIYRKGFNVNDVLICKKGSAGQSNQIDCYIKCGTYARRIAYMMQGENNGWSLVDSNEVSDTTASDPKTSTEVWATISNTSGATEYDTVQEAVDGYSVNYANSSGTSSKASAIIDAGNAEKTITFQYSGSGITTASWLGAWDGYKLTAISAANLRTSIGAAASSHSHNSITRVATRPANPDNYHNNTNSIYTFLASSSMTTHKPPSDAMVLHFNWDNGTETTGTWDAQLALSTAGGKIYRRGQSNGTWSDWYTVYDTGNKPSWNDIQSKPSTFTPSSHTHDYLPLSGGTLSNNLTVSGAGERYVKVVNTNTSNTIYLDSDASNSGVYSSKASNWLVKVDNSGNMTSNCKTAWSNITDVPATYTPASHTHNYAGSSSAGGSATSLSGGLSAVYSTTTPTNSNAVVWVNPN